MIRLILVLNIVFFSQIYLLAQYKINSLYGIKTGSDSIATVQFYPTGYPLGFPALSRYDGGTLLLKFDIFGSSEEQLTYSIELCNSDWTSSELDPMEYLNGFNENPLYPFNASYNTQQDYMHYQLELPNSDIKFLLSGNYIVKIYNQNKRVLLERRFILYDPLTELELNLDLLQSDKYEGEQAIAVNVIPELLSITDLSGNIKLSLIQNDNWQNVKTFDKYSSVGADILAFGINGEIVFYGTNEYRFFDVKSLRFISERVEFMDYKPPYHHIYLKPDRLRGDREYFSNLDLSGNYFIRNQESHDDDMLDAEYVWVHFKLVTDIPLSEDVYIDGAITGGSLKNSYMTYNPETGSYELALLVKQGIYNYRYITVDYNSKQVYTDLTEGNHFETGNDYKAFLYYRRPGDYYDQVIGYGELFTGQEVKEHDKDAPLNVIEQLLKEIAPR